MAVRKDVMADEIYPAVREIADKMGVRYIDMYSVFENKKELFSDGVHPNAKGSKVFAQTVYEAVCKDIN